MEFNFEKEIKCVCGTIYEITDFKKHFTKCQKFKECFGEFDDQLSKFIKSYSQPKEQLLLIKFVFQLYIKILDKKIKGHFIEISKAFRESFMNSFNERNNNENDNNKNNNVSDYDKKFSLNEYNQK